MKPHEFTIGTKFKYTGKFIEREQHNEVMKVWGDKVYPKHGTWFFSFSPYAMNCEIIDSENEVTTTEQTEKYYTAAEVLEIERRAFEAGRERKFTNRPISKGGSYYGNIYETFEDYIKAK